MATREGTLFAGRYRVKRRLGSGAMATVFLAEDERLRRDVAVKRLHADSPEDLAQRFDREARLGASLNHPNIVSVYDTLAEGDEILIVMEYVKGWTLSSAMARGTLQRERALEILAGVAAALDHAHEHGIIHRDVKPSNVLLRTDGVTKLADLGIATAAHSTRITRVGSVLGTPAYMAPEQLVGGEVTPAVDVYALAAVAYEVLSGQKARQGRTPVEIAHKVATQPPPDVRGAWREAPPAVAMALMSGMARDAAERPRSARVLVRALEVAAGVPETRLPPLAASHEPASPPPPASEAAIVPDAASPEQTIVRETASPEPAIPPVAGSPEPAPVAPPSPTPDEAQLPPGVPAAEPDRRDDRVPAWNGGARDADTPPDGPPTAHPATAPSGSGDHDAAPRYRTYEQGRTRRPGPGARSVPGHGRGLPVWLPVAALLAALAIGVTLFWLAAGGESPTDQRAQLTTQTERPRRTPAERADTKSTTAPASPSGEQTTARQETAAPQGGGDQAQGKVATGAPAGQPGDPAQGSRLNAEGHRLSQGGDHEAAVPVLQRAVASFPEDSRDIEYAFALYNLAHALRLSGRPDEAVPLLEKRLTFNNQRGVVQRELELARRGSTSG